MTTFFISDTHFGHVRILKLGRGRPFANIQEMNETLITRWNAIVQPTDTVYCLGDMAFRQNKGEFPLIYRRLHGLKHLVIGNHDNDEVIHQPWETTSLIKEINIDGKHVVLCHYPMRSWNRMYRNGLHLYGHEHGNIYDHSNCVDVGADKWNYTPATFSQIIERMSHLTPLPLDHVPHDKAEHRELNVSI